LASVRGSTAALLPETPQRQFMETETLFLRQPPAFKWTSDVRINGEFAGTQSGWTDGGQGWAIAIDGSFHRGNDEDGPMRYSSGHEHLFEPVGLSAAMRLRAIKEVQWNDRSALAVEALPRDDASSHGISRLLGAGADRYEVVIDAQRGAVLRCAAYVGSRIAKEIEVLEVVFDDDLRRQISSGSSSGGKRWAL
jgi:hypothetical protein